MPPHRSAALLSYRLGGIDGVSVEAAKWTWALGELGFHVTTVAGSGKADVVVPGLGIDDHREPDTDRLIAALAGAELVVAENICSLPLNPRAYGAVSRVMRGRPAILHHHDLATQRSQLSHFGAPPDDASWLHVTINDLSRIELARTGIEAVTIHNRFDPDPPEGRRESLRQVLGIDDDTFLLLHPTRAIARKNVPGALAFCELVGEKVLDHQVCYWLLGAAEDGYGPELEKSLASTTLPVLRGLPRSKVDPWSIDDAYGACDAVVFPSSWEGFGNPLIESATHRRPLAVSAYPVAEELRSFGFRWFSAEDPEPLASFLLAPDPGVIASNLEVARSRFSLSELPAALASAMSSASLY